jgi:hypothetical protein
VEGVVWLSGSLYLVKVDREPAGTPGTSFDGEILTRPASISEHPVDVSLISEQDFQTEQEVLQRFRYGTYCVQVSLIENNTGGVVAKMKVLRQFEDPPALGDLVLKENGYSLHINQIDDRLSSVVVTQTVRDRWQRLMSRLVINGTCSGNDLRMWEWRHQHRGEDVTCFVLDATGVFTPHMLRKRAWPEGGKLIVNSGSGLISFCCQMAWRMRQWRGFALTSLWVAAAVVLTGASIGATTKMIDTSARWDARDSGLVAQIAVFFLAGVVGLAKIVLSRFQWLTRTKAKRGMRVVSLAERPSSCARQCMARLLVYIKYSGFATSQCMAWFFALVSNLKNAGGVCRSDVRPSELMVQKLGLLVISLYVLLAGLKAHDQRSTPWEAHSKDWPVTLILVAFSLVTSESGEGVLLKVLEVLIFSGRIPTDNARYTMIAATVSMALFVVLLVISQAQERYLISLYGEHVTSVMASRKLELELAGSYVLRAFRGDPRPLRMALVDDLKDLNIEVCKRNGENHVSCRGAEDKLLQAPEY